MGSAWPQAPPSSPSPPCQPGRSAGCGGSGPLCLLCGAQSRDRAGSFLCLILRTGDSGTDSLPRRLFLYRQLESGRMTLPMPATRVSTTALEPHRAGLGGGAAGGHGHLRNQTFRLKEKRAYWLPHSGPSFLFFSIFISYFQI